jgi:hypothetical protein
MKYKIVEYQDGYGNSYFRPKEKLWIFPFYFFMKRFDSEYSYYILEFSTREEAQKWINETIAFERQLMKENMRIKV